jgi:heme/copper-type cytochrome/quinol oxidase subunit 2
MRFLIAAAAAAALCYTLFLAGPVRADDNTITITAVPSTFTPDKITLHAGVKTTLVFSHTEGVHAIESSDLGIPPTTIAEGKDVSVDVTPAKPGTYVLHCEVVCGPDHKNMSLTVNVVS